MAALAATEVLLATRTPGPGLDPDAASYLGAGESLAHGGGLTVPTSDWSDTDPTSSLSHFPPGFPIAIAAAVEVGLSPIQGARVIETVAFALTVAIMTYAVGVTVGTLASILLGLALMVARPIVLVHLSVLSEPLFLCLLAATLTGMLRRWHPLAVGTAAAIAALIRYAGVAAVGAAVLWQLVEPGSARRRITRALLGRSTSPRDTGSMGHSHPRDQRSDGHSAIRHLRQSRRSVRPRRQDARGVADSHDGSANPRPNLARGCGGADHRARHGRSRRDKHSAPATTHGVHSSPRG
jgi:4-amino-4-deoxy-L-arabinose transferase and related glycosyltransferases of PMT family